MPHRIASMIIALLALICVGTQAWAGAVGPPIRVDLQSSSDNNFQEKPSVARLSDGSFVVVWESGGRYANPPTGTYISGQRFNVAGARISKRFSIYTPGGDGCFVAGGDCVKNISVAALSNGGFVITWTSFAYYGPSNTAYRYRVFAQRYNSNGSPVGGKILVNAPASQSAYRDEAAITRFNGGGFVVTWTSDGQDGSGKSIYGRRFGPTGLPLGGEFRINTFTTGDQFGSSVAWLNNGGFVVTWTSQGQDGSGSGVYGQRFNSAGTPVGAEFPVNTFTTNNQSESSVAHLVDGGFVVAWSSVGQDKTGVGIYGQRYNAAGTPAGGANSGSIRFVCLVRASHQFP